METLENITSTEYLDKAFENAKSWCSKNLEKHIQGLNQGLKKLDYNILCYVIDNSMIGSDMCLDEKQNGLIRVSTEKLQWYQKRENLFKNDKLKFREPIEVDPESIFVHEIVKFVFHPPLYIDLGSWFSEYFGRAHEVANEIENINRKERGLGEWPKY